MCPHPTTGGRIPLYVTDTTVDVLSVCCVSTYYMCVLILLYMCSHAAISCPHTTHTTIILRYMCPDTTICVLILLYVCPQAMRYGPDAVYMCPNAVYMYVLLRLYSRPAHQRTCPACSGTVSMKWQSCMHCGERVLQL
jgi:hypothetical protein